MRQLRTYVLMLALAWFGLMESEGVAGEGVAAVQGAPAPFFELVTFSGEAYSKDRLKGRPTLLVFWASWCPVCQKELPVLGRFYNKDKPAQLRVISIGFSDLRGNIEQYVKAHPDTFVFPTTFDIDHDVAQSFKVTATPTIVLLDAHGTIVLVHRGAGVLQNPQFRKFLATMEG
ncbi:MAG: TlpA family protein disulfide reductase [Nitrospiraceae bacterium]